MLLCFVIIYIILHERGLCFFLSFLFFLFRFLSGSKAALWPYMRMSVFKKQRRGHGLFKASNHAIATAIAFPCTVFVQLVSIQPGQLPRARKRRADSSSDENIPDLGMSAFKQQRRMHVVSNSDDDSDEEGVFQDVRIT